MPGRMLTTPKGEELIILSREEYEDLVDSRDHALAMAAHARGGDPGLTDAEMDEYLAAPTPLAYWRKRRGLTQATLSAAAGISSRARAARCRADLQDMRRSRPGIKTGWH